MAAFLKGRANVEMSENGRFNQFNINIYIYTYTYIYISIYGRFEPGGLRVDLRATYFQTNSCEHLAQISARIRLRRYPSSIGDRTPDQILQACKPFTMNARTTWGQIRTTCRRSSVRHRWINFRFNVGCSVPASNIIQCLG